jgi:NADPH-dependent curcumin reductase CurA
MATNRRIVLASRPVGFPKDSDFRLEEAPVPVAVDGECVVQVSYLSVDPYMRGRLSERKSYAASVEIGQTIVGGAVGKVTESKSDKFAVGDYVVGNMGWQEYALMSASDLYRADPSLAPLSTWVGVVGMPGLTAYFGLLQVATVKEGETVCVSAGAGAVGSAVGQIAKIKGCRAVGIAGSDEKCKWLTEVAGFDAAVNYKTEDVYQALKIACPDGIDVYFENVGGAVTDALFPHLNERSRIAICGQISQYNAVDAPEGPRLLWHFIVKRIRAEGFLVFDFVDQHQQALRELAGWIRSGQLKYQETVAEGIENAPAAFMSMLQGGNMGKQVVKLSDA